MYIYLTNILKKLKEKLFSILNNERTPLCEAAYGCLDTINGVSLERNEKIGISIHSDIVKIEFYGWSVDPVRKTLPTEVALKVNDNLYKAKTGIIRKDVARFYKNNRYKKSGFICSITLNEIPEGIIKLAIVINLNGASFYERKIHTKIRKSSIYDDRWKNITRQIIPKNKEYLIASIKKHSTKYEVIENSINVPSIHPYYYGDKEIKKINIINPEIYLAELKNVNVFGLSNVITTEKKGLYDLALHKDVKRYDFADGIVVNINKRFIQVANLVKSTKTIEKGIHLCGTATNNYYHFIIESLTRLLLINDKNLSPDIPLLVSRQSLQIPQMVEAFKWYSKGRQYIELEDNIEYKVMNLIYPSPLTWSPLNIKPPYNIRAQDMRISECAVRFLRENAPINCSKKRSNNRKIFLARKKSSVSSYRSLINEEEIVDLLKTKSFEIIYPEKLTFKEQVETFNTASVIIGATGAAFTNILFAPEGCKVYCMMNGRIDFPNWAIIAKILGINLVHIQGRRIKSKGIRYRYQNNYSVDIRKFKQIIEEL